MSVTEQVAKVLSKYGGETASTGILKPWLHIELPQTRKKAEKI